MTVRKRYKFVGLMTVGALSSAIMLWMIWHYPVGTGIATLIVLFGLGMSAKLSRWVDTDCIQELKGTNHSA